MARIIAIDYGTKRVGIAVTDELQLIANPLTTVHSTEIEAFLKQYTAKEKVECIVIGLPKNLQNNETHASKSNENFFNRIKKIFPTISVEQFDERFTSKMAFQTMLDAGLSKSKRQDKEMVDKISASILLQSFLEFKKNKTL